MRERRRRHDDAHMPLGGKGKRATRKHYSPPSAVLVPDTLCPRCAETAAFLDRLYYYIAAERTSDRPKEAMLEQCRKMAKKLRGEV